MTEDSSLPRRYLILDLDGVITSARSCNAFGRLPRREEEFLTWADPLATLLLKRLVLEGNLKVALISSWRYRRDFKQEVIEQALGFSIDLLIDPATRDRDTAAKAFVKSFYETPAYVIVDDYPYKDLQLRANQILVNSDEGFSRSDFVAALKKFQIKTDYLVFL